MLKPRLLDTGRWWDAPWTLVDGCTKVSEGCAHCWSEAIAHRFKRDWTPRFRADRLVIPMRKRRRTVFAVWNDLFHGSVAWREINAAFAVMAMSPRHFFMVLTKRPKRMLEWRRFAEQEASIFAPQDRMLQYVCHEAAKVDGVTLELGQDAAEHPVPWPPPNVALGVTVESQGHVGRVATLLRAWDGLTFVSCEPLLGPVEFLAHGTCDECGVRFFSSKATRLQCSRCGRSHDARPDAVHYARNPDLVITGGESGAGARPMHPEWARRLRDDCKAAGVPYLFKQWGKFRPVGNYTPDGTLIDFVGMERVGRKFVGRMLDGREHNGWFGETT